MTVRAIADEANISTATVGRSRKRSDNTNHAMVASQQLNDETSPETAALQMEKVTV